MPFVIGTRKALSDVESHLQGLVTTQRKTKKLEDFFLSGKYTDTFRPIVTRMLASSVAENFRNKRDKCGENTSDSGCKPLLAGKAGAGGLRHHVSGGC